MNIRAHYLAILLVLTPLLAQAESCKLSRSETLRIGCTKDCGKFNSWAMRWYAKRLGYRLKLYNLSSNKQTIDYTKVDGIVIPGGVDIDPKWYKNDVEPELKAHIESLEYLVDYTEEGKRRDQFEFDLLEKYFANKEQINQPILGICRGMQALTVSQKIPLIVDIKKEIGINNRKYTLDRIRITDKNSLMRKTIRRSLFRGVELHHQALRLDYFNTHKERWPHLKVTAISNGGKIAEALEFSNRPILGVQFHPEYTFGSVRRNIFSWLLKKACQNKKQKTKNKK